MRVAPWLTRNQVLMALDWVRVNNNLIVLSLICKFLYENKEKSRWEWLLLHFINISSPPPRDFSSLMKCNSFAAISFTFN